MKKLYTFLFMCLMATMAKAQVWGDLQLQYDYGHNYGTLPQRLVIHRRAVAASGLLTLTLEVLTTMASMLSMDTTSN